MRRGQVQSQTVDKTSAGASGRRIRRERTQTMTTALRHVAALAISVTVGLGAVAASAEEKPGFIRVTPSEIRWITIPGGLGAKYAVVLGDPTKPGLSVVRAIVPPP
eukprot:gene13009-15002_t